MLKKIISILLLIVCLAGCGTGDGVCAITSGISFVADIEYENECYSYSVEIAENGDTVMTAVSENCLEGSVVRFFGSEICFECNGIAFSTEISALPEGIVSDFIYSVFSDATAKKENVSFEHDRYILNGKTDKYDYSMYLGETGLPIKITDKTGGITATIKNVCIK